ncbi:hypothetical protein TEK04_08585 [Klenkia sp. LSe6-5]|uniref:Uncharacterized protein n=1 Tax=Klenkia sesuvii TaxID=3103137 RepID=A0ABU8DT03_9ACTN
MTTTPFEERPDADPTTDVEPDHVADATDPTSSANDADRDDLMPDSTPFPTPEVTETD